ncbi:hypothetical protein LTR78_005848 [Recurvomyces mirabilis]|uniref:DUF300-domain-containing protein n=1 Tax=Recurvomyces mirabilis TaxID=574656 RepID=A0AAE1C114_9PEZI|nr:hypothetical protein LTR78_005848 [Recurvomyces mirabilis]KAK5154229.1 hypothetical protein LTS14_006914 [Recurvomyces mirabilis]
MSASQNTTKIIYQALAKAEKTCGTPWVAFYTIPLPHLQIHFHQLLTILTATACIISILLALYLLWGHLFHWTKPHQQKQIVRIIVFIPVVQLCQLFSVWFYNASAYCQAWAEYYQGFGITALFLLYLALATPEDTLHREHFFDNLQRLWHNGRAKGQDGSLRWFRILCIMNFQVTLFRTATCLATIFLWSFTCPLNKARQYGFIVITVIQGISTMIAVFSNILLERRLHEELKPHRGTYKLWSFKAVVGLQATQNVIFSVLAEKSVFRPSPPFHISYMDFSVGIPNFMFSVEMLIVAGMFLHSMTFEPYLKQVRAGAEVHATPVGALGLAYAMTPWATKRGHSFEVPEAEKGGVKLAEPGISTDATPDEPRVNNGQYGMNL